VRAVGLLVFVEVDLTSLQDDTDLLP
jgi:hypothetical protein